MSLWQDVRFAVRLLVKDRWFTLVAAVALALGIGVNNTVFTFVNAVLIRGLPFQDPDRIMWVATRDARQRDRGVSFHDFEDWRDQARSFSGLTIWTGSTFNVSEEGRAPDRYQGAYMSANGFKIIGQQPVIGRDFRAEDDVAGAAPVIILGNSVWKTRYGADPSVIGRTIKVNGYLPTVIGVMAEDMKFPNNTDLWMPFVQIPSGILPQARDARNFPVFGRLAVGVTEPQARAELAAIAGRLARDYPDTNKEVQPTVVRYSDRVNGGPIKLVFLSLMGAVAFVLLIACANVANLLLARSAQRAREISVRVSLGASRARIVRQLLVESVLLAVISGIFGFALSLVGVRLFDAATTDVGKPYWIKFTMDASVFAFFAVVCLGTGIIFGLAPALHVSKTDVNEVLKEGGRSGGSGLRARRWTGALIVVELTLTLVLLAGAGFMMRSFLTLYRLDLGIDTSRLLTMRLGLPDAKYHTREQRSEFYRRLEERLGAIPGIQAGTVTSNLPLGGGMPRELTIEGRPLSAGERPPLVSALTIGTTYFDTMGLRLVRGRAFTGLDGTPGHESAIVNQRFVAMHFGMEDPIGRRIRAAEETARTTQPPWLTIVGIAPIVRQRNFQDPDPDPVVYLPHLADPQLYATLVVRSSAQPGSITPLVREEVRALDPDLPLFNIRTMDQVLEQVRWPFRVFGAMFAIFAFIALVLSGVGLYAVTAYSVTQRTREIGIRMALGAQPDQVVWLIVRRGLVQLAIGLVAGLAGAFGVGRLLQSLLVQTSTRDPITIFSIAALMIAVSVAASFWPARRATRLDPLASLRYE